MPILYLILGHMLADFVLQPFKLVRWKYRARSGVFLHSLIHLGVYLLIFAPFLPDLRVIAVITGLAAAHFAIDGLKIDTEKHGKRYHLSFLADQAVHLATLVAGGMLMTGITPNPFFGSAFLAVYGNLMIVAGIALLLFFTYAVEMYRFQFRREKKPDALFRPDYGAMLKRGAIFVGAYALFMVLV